MKIVIKKEEENIHRFLSNLRSFVERYSMEIPATETKVVACGRIPYLAEFLASPNVMLTEIWKFKLKNSAEQLSAYKNIPVINFECLRIAVAFG